MNDFYCQEGSTKAGTTQRQDEQYNESARQCTTNYEDFSCF